MLEYVVAELADDDEFETAETYYLSARDNEPHEAVISYQLASLYMRQNMLDDALACAETAVRLSASKADARALSESRLLVARIHDSIGHIDQALDGYGLAVSLGNATALDMVASHFAGMGTPEGLESWYRQYLQFATGQGKTLEETLAEAILRQPTYSEWHTHFIAATKNKEANIVIRAYKQATRLCKSKNDSLLVQCGCRFHLAQAYSQTRHHRAKAIPLWTWTLNYLTRFKSSWEASDEGTQNRLFTLTIEQLSVSQALSLNHPLVFFAENVDLAVFDYSRIMIMLGKGIERQPHLQNEAATLYRRVLKRATMMARQTGLQNHQIRVVLGDSLLALGAFKDAARALSWACNYRDPVAPRPALPSAEFSNGGGPTSAKEAAVRVARQSLHTRISWYILCDMCMAKRSYSTSMEIFGYRYKCCVCGELDLCEPCYESWKARTRASALTPAAVEELPGGGALRQCSVDHEFMKLPSPEWPEVESESKMLADGAMPKTVPAWLNELVERFGLGLPR
jgi:tetratricopeptide (TPR) repeat protein